MAVVVRTCIGCRKRADATHLLRLVQIDGVITPDLGQALQGRGAHLHPDAHCLDLATRRKAFARALKCEGPLDTHLVSALISDRTT